MFNRSAKSNLLIEVNPYQILVAGFSRPASGSLVLNCAAESDSDDDIGVRQWLDENFEKQHAWVPVICGFVPPESLLQRESPPDYIHLLNPDCEIEPGAVVALLDVIARDPKIGAVASQLLEPDGRIAGSAFRFPSPGREFVRGMGLGGLGEKIGIEPAVVERSDPGPAQARSMLIT